MLRFRPLPILTSLCALVLFSAAAPTSTPGATTDRVLLVGDSWAWYIDQFDSLDEAFAIAGFPGITAQGTNTAISGSTAADWGGSGLRSTLQAEILANPEIDVIHLYIGGNDFLGAWNTGYSAAQEDALFAQIALDVKSLIDFIHSVDPSLEIVYGTYDYINLTDNLGLFDLLLWLVLGSPTASEINSALARSTAAVLQAIVGDPKVHIQNRTGVSQWWFGDSGRGIAPRSVPLPGQGPTFRPRIGGDASAPSPLAAMLDGIHLNPDGYRVLGGWDVRNFYEAYFTANP